MQTWAQVLTRAWRRCVVHRCQNKNPRTRGCEWRHAPEVCVEDFGGFEKSQLSWGLRSEEEGWLSLALSGLVAGATRVVGTDGKASVERLCLPPYVEKPFKVIKSFVPELRSRKCFSCFEIPMFYVYMLWTFYVRFAYSCMGMLHKNIRLPQRELIKLLDYKMIPIFLKYSVHLRW